MRLVLSVVLTAALAAGAAGDEEFDTSAIFEKPQALTDQDGKVILTRRAAGVPAVADWNRDGKCDLVLGAHKDMDTTQAEILLLENVGTRAQPKLQWPTGHKVKVEAPAAVDAAPPDAAQAVCTPFSSSCGCKSGGAFEVQAIDWNRDGYIDLIVNTMWSPGVVLLLNKGGGGPVPTFTRARQLFPIGKRHGTGSGGGDWNNDGVRDYVFPIYYRNWTVYAGRAGATGEPFDLAKPALTNKDYKIVGHEKLKVWGTPGPWFTHTPQAWNYSGKHGAGSKITELVAVMDEVGNKERKRPHEVYVNYYWLDHQSKTCTLKATLHTLQAEPVRMGLGDLNGDGCMDLVYTGGVFGSGDQTHLWVMYGKVRNVPAGDKAKVAAAGGNAKVATAGGTPAVPSQGSRARLSMEY